MAFEATHLDHEGAGVRNRRILVLVGGFLGFVGALLLVLGLYYRGAIGSNRIVEPLRQFSGPRLQPNPRQDYVDFRRSQDAELRGFRWIDKAKNLIHVPIDRAMAFIAARGASAYDPLEPAADSKPSPTPADGESRASTFPEVAPYGLRPMKPNGRDTRGAP